MVVRTTLIETTSPARAVVIHGVRLVLRRVASTRQSAIAAWILGTDTLVVCVDEKVIMLTAIVGSAEVDEVLGFDVLAH